MERLILYGIGVDQTRLRKADLISPWFYTNEGLFSAVRRLPHYQ